MEKLLRVLLLLSGPKMYSLAEIRERFSNSERTIYRHFDIIEKAGFVLEKKNHGDGMRYKLAKNSQYMSVKGLLHFSDEEATLLYRLLSEFDDQTQIKLQLIKKLNTLYNVKALNAKFKDFEIEKIKQINDAITDKKQVHINSYRSSHSGTTTDRIVEPFTFTEDYEAVWCYDISDYKNKLFKISRMGSIHISLREWAYAHAHNSPYMDAFRMSSDDPIATVEADLTLKAYNLMREEFPRAHSYIKHKGEVYRLKIPVASYVGIGRFVLGLPGEVRVIGPPEFKRFLTDQINKHSD